MENIKVFTAQAPLNNLKLISSVGVCNYHKKPEERKWMNVTAKWDTGASICFISKSLADALDLHPESSMPVTSFTGVCECLYDIVALSLMQGSEYIVVLAGVVDSFPHADCDIIIGMNLISQGDFCISSDFDSMTIKLNFKPYPSVTNSL